LQHDTPESAPGLNSKTRPTVVGRVLFSGPAGSSAVAAALYGAIAVIFTWPLVLGLSRDVPWDLGDPLLNAWILAWDANRLLRFLSGDFGALANFFDANIFYPEPLTLAYSEHLFAQSVQILPLYALTGNIILCYNVLFLSTFVLSGLGTYLFVREVTGSPRAAFVAGLIYAFAPYRVPQFSHLQVISSQWMPFVLYGLRRFFATGRVRPLIGAAASLVAQNLSNGHYLLFFTPFVVAYALFEMLTRKRWSDRRVWLSLSAAALAVIVLTLPFLLPYLELRKLGLGVRALNEVRSFSADVFSYWTSPAESRLWGRLIRAYPRAEGDLFPTIAAILLGAYAFVVAVRSAWSAAGVRPEASTPPLRPIVYVLVAASGIYTMFLLLILAGHGFTRIGPLPISVRTLGPSFGVLVAIVGLLLALSPRARSFGRHWIAGITAFAVLAGTAAFLLSMGPEIRTEGRMISELGPYSFFYRNVPGFDGLRVPARYAMLVVLFLAIAAGCGAAAIERRYRFGGRIALALGAMAVVEAFAAPITINGTAVETTYATPPARVYTGENVPAVYRYLKTLPAPGTVIVEFPLGEWSYEARYVFYSTAHWQPLLNGYSGHFPLSYNLNATHLRHPLDYPDASWQTLMKAGATHAVVHEQAYRDDEGKRIGEWLIDHGAKQVAGFEGDRVFALR
jgi:hypothetical protein